MPIIDAILAELEDEAGRTQRAEAATHDVHQIDQQEAASPAL